MKKHISEPDSLFHELSELCDKHGINSFLFVGKEGHNMLVRNTMPKKILFITLLQLAQDLEESLLGENQ